MLTYFRHIFQPLHSYLIRYVYDFFNFLPTITFFDISKNFNFWLNPWEMAFSDKFWGESHLLRQFHLLRLLIFAKWVTRYCYSIRYVYLILKSTYKIKVGGDDFALPHCMSLTKKSKSSKYLWFIKSANTCQLQNHMIRLTASREFQMLF